MARTAQPLLSLVIPVYNEAAGIEAFHRSLVAVLAKHFPKQYEIIYVDDGSVDGTAVRLQKIGRAANTTVLKLSRNFGKEIATTAGIHAARGQAIITMDGDGQHPVTLIPEFVTAWQAGAKVVVGRRIRNQQEGFVKRYGSKLFYVLFNTFAGFQLVPGTTDYRLIDQAVQQIFNTMTERNRITRGLIDWLGYDRTYVDFTATPRQAGEATYSFGKLFKLALDSVISLSLSPLYITAYIGAFVLPVSVLLGLGMLIDVALSDPLNLNLTGGAFVMVLMLFLIGILLVSQGIIGLYLSHVHIETKNRPLYVIQASDVAGSKSTGGRRR